MTDRERILSERLEDLYSAYCHAGDTKVATLKGDIKRRLGSEYDKFLELKGKEPDLDYYEVLIYMVEDIFKSLKKVGIEF